MFTIKFVLSLLVILASITYIHIIMATPTHQSALIVEEIGKPLKLVKRPVPTPGPGEVLVKVASAGINPHDQKGRDYGLFIQNQLPAVLTQDISGTVVSLGDNVSTLTVNDRIFGQTDVRAGPSQGGLQEHVLLTADFAAKIPNSISFDSAATIPVNAVVAFVGLFHDSGLNLEIGLYGEGVKKDYSNDSILVIGGGSNTGKFAIQFAKLAGFGKILTTASTQDAQKVSYLRSLGATHVIDRSGDERTVHSRIRDIVGDDLIYVIDAVNGGKNQTLGLSVLSNSQKGSLITFMRGEVDEVEAAKKKAGYRKAQVLGISHMHPEFSRVFWKTLPGWIEEGVLKPLEFVGVDGLDERVVNGVLDGYRDGKVAGKVHVRPNAV
ncbi:GroES-like protein [Aspergillus karnatakaensis]|uniref:zinc-binding alcohol dehydrogenase family protein n=1 Tax=Aspergillus karnatakaensis TaxID=1810916 RepID=UPI003CCDB40F